MGSKISKVSSVIALILFIVMIFKNAFSKNINSRYYQEYIPFLDSVGPVKRAFVVCIALIVAAVPEGLTNYD